MNRQREQGWEPLPATVTWPPGQVVAGGDEAATALARAIARGAEGAERLEEGRREALASLDRADQRERRRERVTGSITGAFVFFVSVAAFPAPSAFLLLAAAMAGALAGVVAHGRGDHPWAWVLSSFVGAGALAPLVSGPLYALLVVVLAVGSSAAGYFRDPR